MHLSASIEHGCIIELDTARLAGTGSYESCSVVHEVKKKDDFPGLKLPRSEATLPHRASALETLLLRWCVTRVEPAIYGLVLC